MNKYEIALEVYSENTKMTPHNIGELQWADEVIQELIDKQDEISMSKETFIALCRGEIGVMDITGQTLYELTGDIEDFDEGIDEE